MFRRLAVALTLALLVALPASALEKGEFEVALGADYMLLDDDAGVDNGLAPQFRFGWAFSERLGLEAGAQFLSSEDDFGEATELDADLDQWAVRLVWSFGEQDYQPFLLLGAGWADGTTVIEYSEKRFGAFDGDGLLWQAGVGSRWRPARHWGVRVHLLASRVSFDGSFETPGGRSLSLERGLTNLSGGLDFSVVWGRTK